MFARRLIWLSVLGFLFSGASIEAAEAGRLVVVAGLPGTEEMERQIEGVCSDWEEAGKLAGMDVVVVGRKGGALKAEVRAAVEGGRRGDRGMWVVFEGHGYARRDEGLFALRGGDVSGSEIKGWLDASGGPAVVVLGFSSGGAMLKSVAGKGRIVLSGAASAGEENRIRFGGFLAQAWKRTDADEDGDGQISLLEAALYGVRRTRDWYEEKGRILTEHAVWADESGKVRRFDSVKRRGGSWEAGDGGVPSFARTILIESGAERGMSDVQRRLREELEAEVEKVRGSRDEMGLDAYYRRLEELFLRIQRECSVPTR